jgi:serine/threonine protein kinase
MKKIIKNKNRLIYMIQKLERKRYKKNAPNKYHIDCFEKNADYELVRNQNDVSILEAIIETKQQQPIVVKIGTIEKEYHYGKILENAKIPGYIRIFETPITYIPENVLIMPYISEGSLRKFNWTPEYFDMLKSVILQTIMSSFVAYETCGFIHGDFHLDNILLKKTKKQEIMYTWTNGSTSVPTNGYKIVIMDFDSSWMVEEREMGISLYWINLQNMFSRINTDLRTKTGDVVRMKNHSKIMQFIETNIDKKGKMENTLKLIDKIMMTDFEIIENPLSKLVYDPTRWG